MSDATPPPAPDVSGTVFDSDDFEVARTYAEALVNASAKAGSVDAVIDELEEIQRDVFTAQPRFVALLASPSVPQTEKDRLLNTVFGGRAQPTVVRFLKVLNSHNRLVLFPAITQAARALWDQRLGRKAVHVRSAVPLDDGQQAELRERLAKLIDGTPILQLEVDPSLIGGLVIQVGDRLFDASVRNRLEQVRRRLVEQKSAEIRNNPAMIVA